LYTDFQPGRKKLPLDVVEQEKKDINSVKTFHSFMDRHHEKEVVILSSTNIERMYLQLTSDQH